PVSWFRLWGNTMLEDVTGCRLQVAEKTKYRRQLPGSGYMGNAIRNNSMTKSVVKLAIKALETGNR
ncbi:MAG TPA: hypothetical protein VGE79_15180, partial [Niastella sp.]